MSNEDLRAMNLAGTVSVPPKLPDTADITFTNTDTEFFVVATQRISPKLILKRTFNRRDVTAIFQPNDPDRIHLEKGTWTEGYDDIKKKTQLEQGKPSFKGIVFVREHAQSLLEMHTGMTAAESAEYYPPLPDDRSVNHYDMEYRPGCY